jgi:hypothetical protein
MRAKLRFARLAPRRVSSTSRPTPVWHLPNGRLAIVCLEPTRIRRKDTIIQEFEFGDGARLRVPEAVALQDAGAIVLRGYQLIHPRNYRPYFRTPADSRTANNLESLPTFI